MSERYATQAEVDARWLDLVANEPRPCYVALNDKSDLIPRIREQSPDVPVIADPAIPAPLGFLLAGAPSEYEAVRPSWWPAASASEDEA